jgi:hypothetical protein
VGYYEDVQKGFRDYGSPFSSPYPETEGERIGRWHAQLGDPNGAGGGGGGGLALVGFAILIYLLLFLASFVCVAVPAIVAAVPVLAIVRISPGPQKPRWRYLHAYFTTFWGLYAYSAIGLVTALAVTQAQGITARSSTFYGLLSVFDKNAIGYAGLAFWQVVGSLAFAGIIHGRMRPSFAGLLGFPKAWLTAATAIGVSAATVALAFAAAGDDFSALEILAGPVVAIALVAVYALVSSLPGGLLVWIVDRLGPSRHSLRSAWLASFLGLVVCGAMTLITLGAMRPIVGCVREALASADPTTHLLSNWTSVLPQVAAVVLSQCGGYVLFAAVLRWRLGSSYGGVVGWFKSAFVATVTGSLAFLILCVGLWELASPHFSAPVRSAEAATLAPHVASSRSSAPALDAKPGASTSTPSVRRDPGGRPAPAGR